MVEQEILRILQNTPLSGIRYNVIRRPLSGGKGTIVRHKPTKGAKCGKCKGEGKSVDGTGRCPKCKGAGRTGAKPEETLDHFYQRLSSIIKDSPSDFFMRWNVPVTTGDIARFRKECLDPILEQVCDWYETVVEKKELNLATENHQSFRMPYGVYSPLLDGGATELDLLLDTGSTAGLRRQDRLFKELI